MSVILQKHLLLNQLQVKPLEFLKHFSLLTDEAILTFLSHIFLDGELDIFHNLILYLGQEHDSAHSMYSRVLSILLQYQDDIYFYVLDNLIPIILNYHITENKRFFHTNILHLSNYEPLLVKAIHFIEKTGNIDNLIIQLQNVPVIYKPLIKSISEYDEELSNYIENFLEPMEKVKKISLKFDALNNQAYNDRLPHNDKTNSENNEENNLENNEENNLENNEENNLENNEVKEEPIIETTNEELRDLGNHSNKLERNSIELINKAIDNIIDFSEMNHLQNQQQHMEKNINDKTALEKSNNQSELNRIELNNLNTELVNQIIEHSTPDDSNNKPPANYEEYIGQIPIEKMELLNSFSRMEDKDAFLLLAKNKTFLNKELKPSCNKMETLINEKVVVNNNLGTNFKLQDLKNIESKIRGTKNKPIIYFDIQEALLCYGPNDVKNKSSICTHHNVYSDFFYPHQKNRFGLAKQLYNFDVWLLLFQNINIYDTKDSKIGTLLDLYEMVIVLPSNIYKKLVPNYYSGKINYIKKNKFHLISSEDKLTPTILNLYLYIKFFKKGDLLLTPDYLQYIQHGEGISINGQYKYFEEYMPFIANDMEMLKQLLNKLYPGQEFITEKIGLNSIPKKKYSKKRTILQKKKQSKGKKNKQKKKYSKKA